LPDGRIAIGVGDLAPATTGRRAARHTGVLRGQCLDRRIGTREVQVAEIETRERQRNASGARVKWKFTTQNARELKNAGLPMPPSERNAGTIRGACGHIRS